MCVAAPSQVDPIYHMYIECRRPTKKRKMDEHDDGSGRVCVAGPGMHFLDVMYNRWAVQNAQQLRQRILERRGKELGIPMQAAAMGGVGNGRRGLSVSERLGRLRKTRK